jgi:iron(II)-dependent oxidoreductase
MPLDPVLDALADARARTFELALDLLEGRMGAPADAAHGAQWRHRLHLQWVLGHVSWFQEKWVLHHARGARPLRDDADALWSRPSDAGRLPDLATTLAYANTVLDRALEQVHRPYHDLAIAHEDAHGEEIAAKRQSLGLPEPLFALHMATTRLSHVGPWPGDAEVPAGHYWLGALPGTHDFVLDDERWAHPVPIAAFRIARAPVTNEEYARFVDDGGYDRRAFWSDEGWAWRVEWGVQRPLAWLGSRGAWSCKRWDQVELLPEHHPVVHVSLYEAEAFCRWAGRRLPTEAEWELAASSYDKRPLPWGDASPTRAQANLDARAGCTVDVASCPEGDSPYGCRQMIGNVWEWTSSRFAVYPGFADGLSAERTAPALATPHHVLRGGSWATRGRSVRATSREPQPPGRRDLFAGFRTCAR